MSAAEDERFLRADASGRTWPERLGPGTVLLHGFARAAAPALLDELARIAASAPFRHMITPSGHRMSAAMTNSGPLGWVSDPILLN